MMYMVFRRRGNTETLLVLGTCVEFIEHYLKHNIPEEEIQYCVVYEATELNAKDVVDGKLSKKKDITA